MATARVYATDFIRDVAARSVAGGNTWNATQNSDGSFKIQKTTQAAVTTTVWSKVFWNVSAGVAVTDASTPNTDTVTIIDPGSGYPSIGSAQQWLNSLT